jgi:hypothetical protein
MVWVWGFLWLRHGVYLPMGPEFLKGVHYESSLPVMGTEHESNTIMNFTTANQSIILLQTISMALRVL